MWSLANNKINTVSLSTIIVLKRVKQIEVKSEVPSRGFFFM